MSAAGAGGSGSLAGSGSGAPDAFVPVDPAGLPDRLAGAGFTGPVVEQARDRFRFAVRSAVTMRTGQAWSHCLDTLRQYAGAAAVAPGWKALPVRRSAPGRPGLRWERQIRRRRSRW
jgi:hypothetical protein